nr:SOS response-associated peptidase family protein [uncultured Allomuricauda sp.]
MYYRLSNIADLEQIENTFKAKFKHPNIYKPNQLINGLDENLVPIVKQNYNKHIDFAIWGLLPEGFKEEWNLFQSQMNTLNIETGQIDSSKWFKESLELRRSAMITTGFFTSYLKEGEIYPYHVHLPKMQPFAMASIFSELEDGFYTSAIITTNFNKELEQIQDLGNQMPFALNMEQYEAWLSPQLMAEDAKSLLMEEPGLSFEAEPVSKEFFKNEIRFNEFLKRVNYVNLPRFK